MSAYYYMQKVRFVANHAGARTSLVREWIRRCAQALTPALVAVCCSNAFAEDHTSPPWRVVMLYGSDYLLPAVVQHNQALRRTLDAGSQRPIDIYSDAVDAQRFDGRRPGAGFSGVDAQEVRWHARRSGGRGQFVRARFRATASCRVVAAGSAAVAQQSGEPHARPPARTWRPGSADPLRFRRDDRTGHPSSAARAPARHRRGRERSRSPVAPRDCGSGEPSHAAARRRGDRGRSSAADPRCARPRAEGLDRLLRHDVPRRRGKRVRTARRRIRHRPCIGGAGLLAHRHVYRPRHRRGCAYRRRGRGASRRRVDAGDARGDLGAGRPDAACSGRHLYRRLARGDALEPVVEQDCPAAA